MKKDMYMCVGGRMLHSELPFHYPLPIVWSHTTWKCQTVLYFHIMCYILELGYMKPTIVGVHSIIVFINSALYPWCHTALHHCDVIMRSCIWTFLNVASTVISFVVRCIGLKMYITCVLLHMVYSSWKLLLVWLLFSLPIATWHSILIINALFDANANRKLGNSPITQTMKCWTPPKLTTCTQLMKAKKSTSLDSRPVNLKIRHLKPDCCYIGINGPASFW